MVLNSAVTAERSCDLAMEYKGKVDSPLISGEVSLIIGDTGLAISSLLETIEIRYYEMDAVRAADHKVFVIADQGRFVFEKMGQWCEPFYRALREAYDAEMRKALFVSGDPVMTAGGDFSYLENDNGSGADEGAFVHCGKADIELYDHAVCFLTGDINSRRVPLCFVRELVKNDFEFKFILDNGDIYSCSKLGYETDPFEKRVSERIQALREKSSGLLKQIDPGLTSVQLNVLSREMTEGAAVPVRFISDTAPSLLTSIENAILESRIGETFGELKSNSNSESMFVGIKKEEDAEDVMIWIIATSPAGGTCAVEFAGGDDDAAATFIYKYEGNFGEFAGKLNHALEAIDFKKDVVRMSEDDLKDPGNPGYALALKVNKALRLVRSCYSGRLIHSSVDSWVRNLLANFE